MCGHIGGQARRIQIQRGAARRPGRCCSIDWQMAQRIEITTETRNSTTPTCTSRPRSPILSTSCWNLRSWHRRYPSTPVGSVPLSLQQTAAQSWRAVAVVRWERTSSRKTHSQQVVVLVQQLQCVKRYSAQAGSSAAQWKAHSSCERMMLKLAQQTGEQGITTHTSSTAAHIYQSIQSLRIQTFPLYIITDAPVQIADPGAVAHRQLQRAVKGLGERDAGGEGGADPAEGAGGGDGAKQAVPDQRGGLPRGRDRGAPAGRAAGGRLLREGRLLLPQARRDRQRPLRHRRVRGDQVRAKGRLLPRLPHPPHRRRALEDQVIAPLLPFTAPLPLSSERPVAGPFIMQPSPRKGHSGKVEESRQQLEELLSCQICYCRVVQASLCPHCSKLYCEGCLATSLRVRAECPNCRRPLKGPPVQCGRFVGELAGLLQALVEASEEGERCGEHGIALNYFCEDCRRSACCECNMFGRHQHHRFAPISQLYDRKYHHIRHLLSELRARILHQERSLTETENLLIGVKARTEAHIAEIEEHAEKYRQKLGGECEEQGKDAEEQGREDVEELGRESRELGEIKEALLQQLELAQRVNCYRIDQELLDRLDRLLAKNRQRSQRSRNAAAEQAMPQLQLHRVVVANYSLLRAQKQTFFGEPVEYEGSRWRLIVYPSGSTPNSNSLSVFLELLANPDSLNLYLYQIQLLHPHPPLSLTKHHHARFSPNECLGYARFISIEDLQQKQFVNEAEDTLSFAFGVRFCSYYDLYSRRQTLLALLDAQIEAKEEEMRQLEGKKEFSSSSIELE